ncbi:cleavage stimulation factor subunit 2-like [Limulus polyphemus]|uniref:Cleavage stimulation factor subunit 2-like n=1 Tax=Limulus polyphemus TaxID=6850 RepID=A0ABM1BM85_LIMPO|nr:cleavage stimulation factor subunit 2-like [Limulus polyphemus]
MSTAATDRSIRSVFVGNIPYEATEEQLKDIFSEVGPVVSFRLVYDRETGKPKGYGFCEYKDQETALSAMRNLNGYELNGRPLRVDNAASEKNKEELKNLQASLGGPPTESPYGPEVEPEKAPEAISKAVASLPPEQMFELMKQMKLCIQNNPNEARNMLLQNPQLAYALLQAQVMMRIVDPQVALSILHRQNPSAASVVTSSESNTLVATAVNSTPVSSQSTYGVGVNKDAHVSVLPPAASFGDQSYGIRPPIDTRGSVQQQQQPQPAPLAVGNRPRASLLGDRPPVMDGNYSENRGHEIFESRIDHMGDRDLRQPMGDRDMRQQLVDRDMRQPIGDQDLRRMSPSRNISENQPSFDSRNRGGIGGPNFTSTATTIPYDPRLSRGDVDQRNLFDSRVPAPANREDPRGVNLTSQIRPQQQGPRMAAPMPSVGMLASMIPMSARPTNPAAHSALAAAAAAAAPQDQEKAALIMQVLQLSDQQIAMLPPEQRQSILILKEQIARSTQRPQ